MGDVLIGEFIVRFSDITNMLCIKQIISPDRLKKSVGTRFILLDKLGFYDLIFTNISNIITMPKVTHRAISVQ